MTYKEQLLTLEWKNKRLKILKRDGYKCTKCSSTKNLHVHHKTYDKTKMAWQYPNSNFITVCETCHNEIHKGKHISTFFKKKKHKLSKTVSRIEKMYLSMSKKDYELQKRYDKRK